MDNTGDSEELGEADNELKLRMVTSEGCGRKGEMEAGGRTRSHMELVNKEMKTHTDIWPAVLTVCVS